MCIVENLESDYFGKLEPRFSIIRNLNNQVLFIYEGNTAVFEDMPDSDCTGIFIYVCKHKNKKLLLITFYCLHFSVINLVLK